MAQQMFQAWLSDTIKQDGVAVWMQRGELREVFGQRYIATPGGHLSPVTADWFETEAEARANAVQQLRQHSARLAKQADEFEVRT
jgi:hypothetical protein